MKPHETIENPMELSRTGWLTQVGIMSWRAIIVNFRTPGAIVPSLIISAFFLFVYQAQLGGVAERFLPEGHSYLGFILPLSVVSAALGGSSIAGQTIVTDIGTGYFDKLALTPVSRVALLLGPMISNATVIGLQVLIMMTIGLAMGLKPAAGILGLLPVIGFGVFLGVGFSGLTVGIALMTGSPGATGGAGFMFFPLTFLTTTFVPMEQLTGWMRIAATINPITYVLGAMRSLLNDGWAVTPMLEGMVAALVLFCGCFLFALWGLRVRNRRA
jgi:ABC-2 type transport system permease protein